MKNNVISFGNNEYNQCSTLMQQKNGKNIIKHPYYMSKLYDLQMDEAVFIEKILALSFETIIIINPFKRVKSENICINSLERSIKSYFRKQDTNSFSWLRDNNNYDNIFYHISNYSNEEFRVIHECNSKTNAVEYIITDLGLFQLFPKISGDFDCIQYNLISTKHAEYKESDDTNSNIGCGNVNEMAKQQTYQPSKMSMNNTENTKQENINNDNNNSKWSWTFSVDNDESDKINKSFYQWTFDSK